MSQIFDTMEADTTLSHPSPETPSQPRMQAEKPATGVMPHDEQGFRNVMIELQRSRQELEQVQCFCSAFAFLRMHIAENTAHQGDIATIFFSLSIVQMQLFRYFQQ